MEMGELMKFKSYSELTDEEKRKRNIQGRRNIVIFICIVFFIFIIAILTLSGSFEKSIEAENIRQNVLRFVDKKNTKVFIDGTEIEGKEKKIILKIFTGEEYESSPFDYNIFADIHKMQEVKVRLKKENQEIEVRIFQNFNCFNNKNKEYLDKNGNYCDMSTIIKVNYDNQEKTLGLFATDEALKILKKYRKGDR
jgi:hypothetical protein